MTSFQLPLGDVSKEIRYDGVRKPFMKREAVGFALALAVTVKQVLLNTTEISSSLDFRGLEVEKPSVYLQGNVLDEKLLCGSNVTTLNAYFGVATFNTQHTGAIYAYNLGDTIPIYIDIPFRKKRRVKDTDDKPADTLRESQKATEGTEGTEVTTEGTEGGEGGEAAKEGADAGLSHAFAYALLKDWAIDLRSKIENTKKPVLKEGSLEANVYIMKKKTNEKKLVGTVYFHFVIGVISNIWLNAENLTSTFHMAPIDALRDALTGWNAENVANHIFNMYTTSDVEFPKAPRKVLSSIVKFKQLLPAAEMRKERKKPEPINPYAFYTLTDLLCMKAENPVEDACNYVSYAGKQEENALSAGKLLQARQWGVQKTKCEDRANKLMDIAAEVSPTQFGNIGYTWFRNLMWEIPDLALKIYSPKIAGNPLSVDFLFNRWSTKYTNRCWGLSCFFPWIKSTRLTGMINSPSSTFWSNAFFYMIFLLLATIMVCTSDPGLYQYHTALQSTYIDIEDAPYGDITDADSFYAWANKAFVEQLEEQMNQTNLLGNLVFRQFRVKASPCSSDSSDCYDDLDIQSNLIRDGDWKGTEWDSKSNWPNIGSIYGFLPSGGFRVNIPGDPDTIKETLQNLSDSEWIDQRTRAISVQFVIENPNAGLYAIIVMTVEWSAVGVATPGYFIYILPVGTLEKPWIFYLLYILLILSFGYLVQELYEFFQEKDKVEYLSNIFNWIDFGLFLFYLAALCTRFSLSFPDGIPDDLPMKQLHSYWLLFFVQSAIEATFVLILWLRLSYFFRANQYAGSLLVITMRMLSDILYFVSLVIIVVVGVAVLMDVLLHSDFEAFSGIWDTIWTLFFASLGHGDFLETTPGGYNILVKLGNVIFALFVVVVTILLINLLIAILNGSYTDLKEQATGIWALQYVELIQRCESQLWPPPFNLIGLIYYAISLSCCPNLLRSYIVVDDKFSVKEENILKPIEPDNYFRLDEFTVKSSSTEAESRQSIWIIDLKPKPSAFFSLAGILSPRRNLISSRKGRPEEKKKKVLKDSLHLQIINESEEIIDIYLNYAHLEKYFLVSLLPKTCIWLASIPMNTRLSAFRHNNSNDIYYVLNPSTGSHERVDPHPFINELNLVQVPRPTDWKLPSIPDVEIAYKEPTHPHDLVFVSAVSDGWACDTCSASFGNQAGFICCEYHFKSDCNYGICSACFYELRMKKTIPYIEEELSLLMEGERWWGEEIFKPRITFAQNRMVRKMVEIYVDERQKQVKKTALPEEEFIDFFSNLATTLSGSDNFDFGGSEGEGSDYQSSEDLPIEETGGDDLGQEPGEEPGEEGGDGGDDAGAESGEQKDDVELELSGKPSDPDTKYVLLEPENEV